jgi:hypothetical protein
LYIEVCYQEKTAAVLFITYMYSHICTAITVTVVLHYSHNSRARDGGARSCDRGGHSRARMRAGPQQIWAESLGCRCAPGCRGISFQRQLCYTFEMPNHVDSNASVYSLLQACMVQIIIWHFLTTWPTQPHNRSLSHDYHVGCDCGHSPCFTGM